MGRENELFDLKQFALGEDNDTWVTLITGDVGIGKTTLLCKMIDELSVSPESCAVLPFLCGIDIYSMLFDNLVYYVYYTLWKNLQTYHDLNEELDEYNGYTEAIKSLKRLVEYAAGKTRIVIIADEIDSMIPCEISDSLLWLRELQTKDLRVIISCYYDNECHAQQAKNMNAKIIDMIGFSKEIAEKYIDIKANEVTKKAFWDYPYDSYGLMNRLKPLILSKVTDGLKGYANPLYTNLLIQKVAMTERYDMEKINEETEHINDRENALYDHLVKYIENERTSIWFSYCDFLDQLHEWIHVDIVYISLFSIAWSRRGLRIDDFECIWENISGLSSWNSHHLFKIRHILGDFLLMGDLQQLDFSHQTFRDYYRVNSTDKDPYEDEQMEEIAELNDAVAMTFFEDDSIFGNRELMHQCRWARNPFLAGKAIIRTKNNEQLRELYAKGLRDIIYSENDPDFENSFIMKIFKRAAGGDVGPELCIYEMIIYVVSLLKSVIVSPRYKLSLLTYVILSGCKITGESTGAIHQFLVKAEELANEQYLLVKEEHGLDSIFTKAARTVFHRALKQISSFYREHGMKKEASEYKSKMMSIQ